MNKREIIDFYAWMIGVVHWSKVDVLIKEMHVVLGKTEGE